MAVFGHAEMYGDFEDGGTLRRLRLAWPNPPPPKPLSRAGYTERSTNSRKELSRQIESREVEVEGECDDVLVYLRLWDGLDGPDEPDGSVGPAVRNGLDGTGGSDGVARTAVALAK
jgi:hypothetical protein